MKSISKRQLYNVFENMRVFIGKKYISMTDTFLTINIILFMSRFGHDLQKTFKPILIGQMVVVIPNFIINIYVLSVYTDRLNVKYFMTIFFALVPTMQIYMFCWYGNEIFLGVSNIIKITILNSLKRHQYLILKILKNNLVNNKR